MTEWAEFYTDTAVRWTGQTTDAAAKETFPDAAEIACMWEDRNETFQDDSGEEIVSRARIYTDVVLEVGDWVFLGKLTDLASGASTQPADEENSFQVKGKERNPDPSGEGDVLLAWFLV
jgi:hypothetical protein